MNERKASVIVCDEFTWSLTGKANFFGVYVQDIVIPIPEVTINQMVFFFSVETDANDPFKQVELKVEFPGSPPFTQPIAMDALPMPPPAGRTKITYRFPIMLQQRVLRPGRIATSVIHERGELSAGGVWIVQQPT
ncbi:MAG: hypothetical protein J0H38_01005 [Rhizobiales bacterium]|nr:hypothetical protein [Hyphomicrobiales bacterium]